MVRINNEYYLSFEVAKLLKEFGFDWECRCYYETSGKLRGKNSGNFYNYNSPLLWQNNGNTDTQLYSAPTLDVAQRWLREVKNIRLLVETGPELYIVESYTLAYGYWTPTCLLHDGIEYERFYTYEKALEAGIKKALEIILKEK